MEPLGGEGGPTHTAWIAVLRYPLDAALASLKWCIDASNPTSASTAETVDTASDAGTSDLAAPTHTH